MAEATCTAPVNIAVIKYWGKRSVSLILPTNSSLSVTLSQDHLRSLTSAKCIITQGGTAGGDRLWLNGVEEEIVAGGRTERCLEEMRKLRIGVESANPSLPILSSSPLHIASENNFPTAAGLASSASGLSALIATLSSLYSLESHGITVTQLSRIARQGSGSACRSMFGGFVAWEMGAREDGEDSEAYQVAEREDWKEMQALILVVSDKKKGTASTVGMQRTVATSPLLQHRIKNVVPGRMKAMEAAIKGKDFDTFADLTMKDSNQFHSVCLDTSPPIFYLNDLSKSIIQLLEELNRCYQLHEKRTICAYTFDAGPNAVIYALEKDIPMILNLVLTYYPQSTTAPFDNPFKLNLAEALVLPKGFNEKVVMKAEVGAVSRIIHTEVGDGPRVLGKEESLLGEDGMPKNLK